MGEYFEMGVNVMERGSDLGGTSAYRALRVTTGRSARTRDRV